MFHELRSAADRFIELAQDASDPLAPVPATPGWRVADLVAHVTIEVDRYARAAEGRGEWSASPLAIAETNARALAALKTRDIVALTDRLRGRLADYVTIMSTRDADLPSHGFDGGFTITPRQGAGVLLGELAVHGRDLALASGQRAPLAASTASLVLDGVLAVLPVMLDRDAAAGVHLSVEIRLIGGRRHRLHIDDGAIEVDGPQQRRPDAVVVARPVPFLLVSYGRIGRVRAILSGGAITWGRRADRALMLDRLFHSI
jgi:uncharacterized protein (TIGR03083 family)